MLFKLHIAFAWIAGRGLAKEKKLDLKDALHLIILGRLNDKPSVMQQECGWIAEDISCSREDALIALGRLMGSGLIAT